MLTCQHWRLTDRPQAKGSTNSNLARRNHWEGILAQRKIGKLAIFSGLLASAAAIPAYAQSVQGSAARPTQNAGPAELTEIIVTASRRAENLQ
jgi:hypothetical protein